VRDDPVVVDDAKLAHSGDSDQSRTWWRIGSGDEEFLAQRSANAFARAPVAES
jgi:hypothetical protein